MGLRPGPAGDTRTLIRCPTIRLAVCLLVLASGSLVSFSFWCSSYPARPALPCRVRQSLCIMLSSSSCAAFGCWTCLTGRSGHASQVYTLKALMPDRRTRFAAAVFNDQIWVIGGYNNVAGTGVAASAA